MEIWDNFPGVTEMTSCGLDGKYKKRKFGLTYFMDRPLHVVELTEQKNYEWTYMTLLQK